MLEGDMEEGWSDGLMGPSYWSLSFALQPSLLSCCFSHPPT